MGAPDVKVRLPASGLVCLLSLQCLNVVLFPSCLAWVCCNQVSKHADWLGAKAWWWHDLRCWAWSHWPEPLHLLISDS